MTGTKTTGRQTSRKDGASSTLVSDLEGLKVSMRGIDTWGRMSEVERKDFETAVGWWLEQPESTRPRPTTIVNKLIERGLKIAVSTGLRIFHDIARR